MKIVSSEIQRETSIVVSPEAELFVSSEPYTDRKIALILGLKVSTVNKGLRDFGIAPDCEAFPKVYMGRKLQPWIKFRNQTAQKARENRSKGSVNGRKKITENRKTGIRPVKVLRREDQDPTRQEVSSKPSVGN